MKPLPCTATVLQTTGLLVTDMTYEATARSHRHDHELPFVGIVLAGGIEKELGQFSLTLTTGGVYVMPAGVPHVDCFPTGVRLLTLELDPETELWDPCEKLVERVRRLRSAALASIARQIAVELNAVDDLRVMAVEGLSLELFAAAARSIAGTNGRHAPVWLTAVDEFLSESFFRPLTIAEIAAVVHVHPAHLARVFRTHYGETIGHRLRRLRLDWTIGQLVEGDRALRDIATQAGFAHQSHFTRSFKAYTGWSPAQYRIRQRRKRY
jgi:AraC family transcriptional regulator